jgi:hypothetical protein
MDAGRPPLHRRVGIWEWASSDRGSEPDVVLACAGDVPTWRCWPRPAAAPASARAEGPVINVRGSDEAAAEGGAPPRPVRSRLRSLFTRDRPVIFAYHGYPWLIHRLTYRRTNHDNLHVRGYKEEGTTTTPFDMVVLNDLDRFHLVSDVIDRVPGLRPGRAYVKQAMRDHLIEHKRTSSSAGRTCPKSATGPGPPRVNRARAHAAAAGVHASTSAGVSVGAAAAAGAATITRRHRRQPAQHHEQPAGHEAGHHPDVAGQEEVDHPQGDAHRHQAAAGRARGDSQHAQEDGGQPGQRADRTAGGQIRPRPAGWKAATRQRAHSMQVNNMGVSSSTLRSARLGPPLDRPVRASAARRSRRSCCRSAERRRGCVDPVRGWRRHGVRWVARGWHGQKVDSSGGPGGPSRCDEQGGAHRQRPLRPDVRFRCVSAHRAPRTGVLPDQPSGRAGRRQTTPPEGPLGPPSSGWPPLGHTAGTFMATANRWPPARTIRRTPAICLTGGRRL